MEIPDSITSIGNSVFNGCFRLESIVISDNVTSIGYQAFMRCYSLESIVIPNSVISIGREAFCNCTNLSSIKFESSEGWWYSEDSDAVSGTGISSSDLSNTSTAAEYLGSTYRNYYWKRS